MSENYIVINGKKAELTEEQLEKLGIKPEKIKYEEMFELSDDSEPYFFINDSGRLVYQSDMLQHNHAERYACGNVCKDKNIMKQRALHETLNRLLWRASVIAGELDNEWNNVNKHYYIYKYGNVFLFDVRSDTHCLGIYFPSSSSAADAIENIVMPFLNEHPDFVW